MPQPCRGTGLEHEFVAGSVASGDVAGDDQIDLFGPVARPGQAIGHRLPGEVDRKLVLPGHPPIPDAGQAFQRYADLGGTCGEDAVGRHHLRGQVRADAFDHRVSRLPAGRVHRYRRTWGEVLLRRARADDPTAVRVFRGVAEIRAIDYGPLEGLAVLGGQLCDCAE